MKRKIYLNLLPRLVAAAVLAAPAVAFGGEDLPDLASPHARPAYALTAEKRMTAYIEAQEAKRIAKASASLPPWQKLAADLVYVFALPEEAQGSAMRTALIKHADTIAYLVQSQVPPPDVLEEKLWSQIPPVSEDTKRGVTKLVTFIKSDLFKENAPKYSPVLIKKIPAARMDEMLKMGADFFQQAKVSEHPSFAAMLDPKTGINIEDENVRALAQDLLPKFFDDLPVKLKARMVAAALRVPAGAGFAKQASAVLQDAGPLVQKLFQLIGSKTDSPDLAAVMKQLKADIKPVPQEQVMAILKRRFGAKELEEKFEPISKAIASGSVGQVHLSKSKATGEEVAIKVLRPNAKPDFAAESAALRSVAKGTPNEGFAESTIALIGEELDFRIEAAHVKEAAIYIDPKHGIGIAQLAEGFEPAEDVLVSQKAPGKPITKFEKAEDLVRIGKGLEDLAANWIYESVFDGGFFHGDAHGGNVFFDPNADNKQGYKITFIDFGNSNRLSRTEQKGFMHLLTGVIMRSPEETLSGLAMVADIPEAKRAVVLEGITQALKTPPSAPLHRWFDSIMEQIGKVSVVNGVKPPDSFLSFQRGKAFFGVEIDLVNAGLDKVDPEKKLPRFDPNRAQIRAVMRELKSTAADKIMRRSEKDPVLSTKTLQEVAKAWKSSPYYEGSGMGKMQKGVRALCSDYYKAVSTGE